MAIEFCGVDRTRKHRVHQWFNTETMERMFGVQANVAYGRWAHVCVPTPDGSGVCSPILFSTRIEANAHIRALATPPHEKG